MTLNTIAKSIRSLTSIKGGTNDVLHKWLKTFGIEGATNDLLVKQLEALGYTGSLNDMLAAIESDTFVDSFRNLIQLDPVANSYYELAKPVTFSGDFEIEVDALKNNDETWGTLISSENIRLSLTRVPDIGDRRLRFDHTSNAGFQSAINLFELGKLNSFGLRRTGSTVEGLINGVVVASATDSGAVEISAFGKSLFTGGGDDFLDGIISNVVLRDLDTPSNTQTFRLNQLNSDIEYPVENVFGSNLSDTPATTVPLPWVSNGGSSYSIDGTQTATIRVFYEGLLNANSAYSVEITTSNSTAGGVRPETAIIDLPFSVGNGVTSWIFQSTSNTNFNIEADPDFDGDVTYTIREITNAVTYENIGTGLPDRDTYTLVDGYWTGSNIVTQDVWENPFTANDQWTYDVASNTWELTGDGSFHVLQLFVTTDQPPIMQVKGEITALSGAGILASSGGGGGSTTITETGAYTRIVDLDINASQLFKRSTGVVNATLTKPSIKRLIEVA